MAQPAAVESGRDGGARSRRAPPWSLALVAAAVIAVAIAFAVGLIGLTANPVKSRNPDGTTTLQGSFEPYQCSANSCNGYLQAGARSVFVQFPPRCPQPARGSTITVLARSAIDLGSAAYRATRCA